MTQQQQAEEQQSDQALVGGYDVVPLDHIRISRQPRANAEQIDVLAESITKIGVLHAPVVVPDGEGYYRLVAGASRFRAMAKTGAKEMWCHIIDYDLDTPEAQLAFIDENLVRTELTPAERDELRVTRKKLVVQIDPSKTTSALKAAAGRKGGQLAGRSRPLTDEQKAAIPHETSKRDKTTDAAIRRKERSHPKVWDAYEKQELKQYHVDQLIRLDNLERQAGLISTVKELDRAETKSLITMVEEIGAVSDVQVAHAIVLSLRKRSTHLIDALDRLLTTINRVASTARRTAVDESGWDSLMTISERIVELRQLTGWSPGGKSKGKDERPASKKKTVRKKASSRRGSGKQ